MLPSSFICRFFSFPRFGICRFLQRLFRVDRPPLRSLDLLPENASHAAQYKGTPCHKNCRIGNVVQWIEFRQDLEVGLGRRAAVEFFPDLVGIEKEAGVLFYNLRIVVLCGKSHVSHGVGDGFRFGRSCVDGFSQGQDHPCDAQPFFVGDELRLSVIDQSKQRRTSLVEYFGNASALFCIPQLQYIACDETKYKRNTDG